MKSRDGAMPKMTLAVLAGGRSRRMGRDKAFLPLGGSTLIEETVRPLERLFDEVLIAVSPGQAAPPLPWKTVEDDVAGEGPLRGILTALRNARHEVCFVLACDAPGLTVPVARKIIAASVGVDIAVGRTAGGLIEPLLGVYRKSVTAEIEALLSAGERSILPLFRRVKTREVVLTPPEIPANVNTPDDFRALPGNKWER